MVPASHGVVTRHLFQHNALQHSWVLPASLTLPVCCKATLQPHLAMLTPRASCAACCAAASSLLLGSPNEWITALCSAGAAGVERNRVHL